MPVFPLDPPTSPAPKSVRFNAQSVVSASRSPFTGQRQIYVFPANWWQIQVTLPPMKRAQAEPWIAFLTSLNGMEGTFNMGDPLGVNPRGLGGGTPRVAGAGQASTFLQLDGWPASRNVLKTGDWLQIGTGLYKVYAEGAGNVNSDATGHSNCWIWPRLKTPPADNAPVIYTNTKGVFRLDSNSNGWDWSEPALAAGLTFTASEAF